MKVDSMMQSMMSYPDTEAEDDLDVHSESHSHGGHHNKAEIRKSNKPIMEKRRRARINNCLNDLKGILLEAMRKDPARHSKLEKADILELTVRHLQNVQRNQLAIAMATDPTVLHRFKNGFAECATEVSRYMARLEGVDPGIRQRLTGHLGACVNGLQQVGPMTFGAPRYSPLGLGFAQPPAATPNTLGIHPAPPSAAGLISPQATIAPMGDVNNNRYNTGHTPPSATVTSSTFHNSNRIGSAFSTVPTKRPPTPPPSPTLSPQTTSSFHETDTPNISTGSDSSISMMSMCENFEKSGHGAGSLMLNASGTTPLDFSLHRVKREESGSIERHVKVLKVEPMSVMMPSEPNTKSSKEKDNMWRPW